MKKLYVLTPEEFDIKIQAHALQVRQQGAIRNGFHEPTDPKTLSVVARLEELRESIPTVLGNSVPDVVTGYFNLFEDVVKRLDKAGNEASTTDEERFHKFGEVAVCMFVVNELGLMGIS